MTAKWPARRTFSRLLPALRPLEVDPFISLLVQQKKVLAHDPARSAVPGDRPVELVLERFCPRKEPAKDIAIHFSKKNFMKEPFDRPSEFEIHSLKKYKFLNEFDVNSWVRIKSGSLQLEKGVFHPVVIAHQDINTLTELMDKKVYNNEDITNFFSNVSNEFDEILKQVIFLRSF